VRRSLAWVDPLSPELQEADQSVASLTAAAAEALWARNHGQATEQLRAHVEVHRSHEAERGARLWEKG